MMKENRLVQISIMNRAIFGLLLVLLLNASAIPGRAADAIPIRVTVTDTVLRSTVPRIGFNVCQNPSDDKSTLLENCLNSNPGLESGVVFRRLFVAMNGDARSFTILGDYGQRSFPASFWVGTEFRVMGGKATGRKGKITACVYGDPYVWCTRFTVDGDGTAFAAGDVVWLSQPGLTGKVAAYPSPQLPEQLIENDRAPFHGGITCVKLTADKFWKIPMIWLPSFPRWGGGRGGDRGGNADRFLQEKTYRITLWAKGTPGAKGSVRFVSSSEPGSAQPDDFVLTDTWKKYELIRKSDPMVNICIVLSGGDDMYLDNFTISEDDGGEPCAMLPRVIDALADLKPGTLRVLGGARDQTLDNWLAHPLERLRIMDYDAGGNIFYRAADQPNLPDSLNLCERVGAAPWLVMGLAMTDEEWDNLLEYLAGPVDSPYGAKRAKNGQPDSWLKSFDKVYLELGDEVWNRDKAPWCVPDAAQYAAWAERVFNRVKHSKYFSDKIRLVADGNATDAKWNAAVLQGCPSMDVLSCATVLSATANVDKAVMQTQLLASPTTQLLPQLASVTQAAKTAGKASALGGCLGVSAEASFLGPERSLLRSQSAAVAVMDQLLQAVADGCEAVEYSRFAQGSDNATHVDAHSLVLHPTAQAIQLYNLYAGGKDLVTSSIMPLPTDGRASCVPALASYAFKGKGSYSVLLLNRSLISAFRVSLALPTKRGKVHCYRIASEDPLANNLNEMQVKTEVFDGDPTAGIALPAHSILLLESNEVIR